MRAPSEKTIGRNRGRDGAMDCNSPSNCFPGIEILHHRSRTENRAEGFRVGPGAVPLQNFRRRARFVPLLFKLVEGFAAGEAGSALVVALLLGFFDVDFVLFGVVGDVVDVPGRPVGNNFLLQIFENFFGIAFERIAIAGAAAAEAEEQIAFVVDLRSAGDQLEIPIAVDRVSSRIARLSRVTVASPSCIRASKSALRMLMPGIGAEA